MPVIDRSVLVASSVDGIRLQLGLDLPGSRVRETYRSVHNAFRPAWVAGFCARVIFGHFVSHAHPAVRGSRPRGRAPTTSRPLATRAHSLQKHTRPPRTRDGDTDRRPPHCGRCRAQSGTPVAPATHRPQTRRNQIAHRSCTRRAYTCQRVARPSPRPPKSCSFCWSTASRATSAQTAQTSRK